MEKQYNRVKAESFFEIESIIYLAHANSARVTEEYKKFDFWQMYYCVNGTVLIQSDKELIKVPAHHAIFLDPRGDYRSALRSSKEEDAEFYVISFECRSKELYEWARHPIPLIGNEPTMIAELCTAGRRVLQPMKMNELQQGLCIKAQSHPAVLQYVKISLEQLLVKIYCRLNHIEGLMGDGDKSNRINYEKEIVDQVHRFMYDNISRKLTMDDITQGLGVNATTLRIAYKKETGNSIMQDFSNMKMAEAMRLIRESNLNFTQIGEYLGFLSLYHFSRAFKERTGITLSEYSKQRK